MFMFVKKKNSTSAKRNYNIGQNFPEKFTKIEN